VGVENDYKVPEFCIEGCWYLTASKDVIGNFAVEKTVSTRDLVDIGILVRIHRNLPTNSDWP
jgi:hypothetical protein